TCSPRSRPPSAWCAATEPAAPTPVPPHGHGRTALARPPAAAGDLPVLHLVSRTAQFLSSLTESVSALLLGAIVVINLLQVLFRYVIGAPLGWTEEVMRYSVVWLTFLASVAALHRGEHMVIDVLGTALPRRLRRPVYLLVLLCIAAFCWILVAEGFPLALRNAAQFSPSARIP